MITLIASKYRITMSKDDIYGQLRADVQGVNSSLGPVSDPDIGLVI
ncbi:hypothetical protein [Nocardiopsis sp. M1B1]